MKQIEVSYNLYYFFRVVRLYDQVVGFYETRRRNEFGGCECFT